MPDRVHLRAVFDEDAERYDRARPGYPAVLFDDLARLAGIGPGCRVLEIGCGTGQASVPLAGRGCSLVCVELGAHLAAVARRNLARFPSTSVEVADFDGWPLPPVPFDTMVAATAFHWLDPATRVAKAAQALRPGGALVTITTRHIAGDGDIFFYEVQPCYQHWHPGALPFRLLTVEEVPFDGADLAGSALFQPAIFRRYAWDQEYTTAQYLDMLLTYSENRALPDAARQGLMDCIATHSEGSYGGRIRLRYLNELRVAYRS